MILPTKPIDVPPPKSPGGTTSGGDADEEARGAREAQRQNRQELRALAESMPQLAWIAEQDGAMVWYNRRWYDYTGTTPEQMAGEGWKQVYAPDCLQAISEHWRHCQASGEPFELEVPIRGADGTFRWFLTRANPVHNSAGRLLRWFGTSTDVDQVKRAQEALRDETAVLETLNRTGTALASTRDLGPLLQEVTDAATSISGARFGALFYHSTNADGDALMLHTLSSGAPEAFSRFGQPRATTLFAPGMCGQGVVRSDDLLADPRYGHNVPHRGVPEGHPQVRSYLAVPVALRSGAVIGCLMFGHPEARMFTERTERILVGIAAQAAVAIDNARLHEASQRAAQEREQLLGSERQARAEAERNSRMKDEFLATLSHELRTPLTAILGWSQVLRRGSRDQADLHRGLLTIERNARAQAQLIEDLLDMGSITSGKVHLDMRALAPATVVAAAVETVRPAADVKRIRIEQRFDPAAGLVAADANRLQQVVWNLLNNAIKFTPPGGRVEAAVRRDGEHIEIAVSDTGIGIAPGFLAHAFERFRQADATTTRQHGGLGLGLSIVRHLVEQHGGTVSAASQGEGHGACFTVRLPRHADEPPAPSAWPRPARTAVDMDAEPSAPGAAGDDLADLRVLVVDDDEDARELIRRILSDRHADVLTAATAGEALDLLEHERPDLLVSDLGMPDVDGYGLLARIRALGPARGGDLPAIALSAFARSEDRSKALASGFLAHLAKPVEPDELVARVAAAGLPRRPG